MLRLVCSGIPDAKEWDGFYNGTDSGWKSFLRTLQFYLEHHRGEPRTTLKVIGMSAGSPEDAWERLTAGLATRGRIVFEHRPKALEAVIPGTGDGYLAHTMSKQFVYTMLSVYGKSPAEVEAIRADWQPWLSTLLGIASA